jgi:uncharacterized protein
MVLNIIKFLSVVLLISFSTHYFLFFSWIRFFNINTFSSKLGLFLIVFFLSITFILSSIFIHISNNPFTRYYYLFSGTWLGLMSILLIMTAFVWLVKGGLLLFPNELPIGAVIKNLCYFLYGIAIIYTGFCHYQFYRVEIKPLTIPVKNLPQQWENKKIIHLSDLHLGGTKDLKFLKKVISMTNDQNAALILITGDLFDGATNSQERYVPDLNNFKAKHGIVFTSGNHEIYSGVEKSRKLIEQSNIIMLDNKSILIDGLQILGISYPEFNNTSSFDFDNPETFAKDLPTILLYHTPTSIKANGKNLPEVRSSDYLAPDTTFANAMNNGISLQLSGHTHAGQFFPFTWITDRLFKGFHYGLHKIDNFYINISSGTGSWGPPLRSHYLSEIVVITLIKANEK